MNSPMRIIAIIIGLLILGSGGYFFLKSIQNPSTSSTSKQTAQPTSSSVIGSIKDALSKSVSLQCSYTDEQGRKTTSFIKNGQIRADIVSSLPQESGSVLIKDKKMYFWNAQKQGFTMQIPDQVPQTTPGVGQSTQQDLMKDLEKYKSDCRPAVISDSEFALPAGITFTDYSTMMPTGGTAMPTGSSIQPNSQDYQKAVQQYMQKYQNQQPSGQ